ncbi:hypothetical protein [Lentzea albida]|uniref:hypothetical protein n=1 Tax=Lentzea albida TaxID=65499 RepID=UPI000B7D1687|nr:hypothetical protein [Lentzea albida]
MSALPDRKRSRRGLVSVAVGILLGVASMALPSVDALWAALGVARDLRTGHSTGLAILFLCLGFLVAQYFQQEEFKAELERSLRAESARLEAGLPAFGLLTRQTGDEAMATLTGLVATARSVANTRISPSKVEVAARHGAGSAWDRALLAALQAGLAYREVVSPNHADLARSRRAAIAGSAGVYEAAVVRHLPSPFLNFIVVEQRDGTKEVWFGWLASRTSGFDGTVMRTGETHVVSLFERWHTELLGAGTPVR